jgi:hypothetical protein
VNKTCLQRSQMQCGLRSSVCICFRGYPGSHIVISITTHACLLFDRLKRVEFVSPCTCPRWCRAMCELSRYACRFSICTLPDVMLSLSLCRPRAIAIACPFNMTTEYAMVCSQLAVMLLIGGATFSVCTWSLFPHSPRHDHAAHLSCMAAPQASIVVWRRMKVGGGVFDHGDCSGAGLPSGHA